MSSSADHLPQLRDTIRQSWSALFDAAAGFIVSGVILALLGVDPFVAFASLLRGAFGYPEAIGYTLYYTTTYIFAGLAVWIGLQAGLFNIGGEGQIYLGGLGAGLVCGAFANLPGFACLPLACVAAALFGAAWAFVPALLLAKRGSSIVVTTIMFNFIAASLMTWLLTSVMIAPGQAAPETPIFPKAHWMPSFTALLGSIGIQVANSPANLSLFLALLAIPLARFVIDRTVFGYEARVLGASPEAAVYAGISSGRITLMALCLSGALAGLAGVNEVAGVHHRIILDFPNGAGFVAIAVALMAGRNAWGVLPAAILFAALSQGSVDLMIDNPRMNRDLVVLVQGLVTLFAGAMRGRIRLPRPAPKAIEAS
jgi:simple sugar transport system permease protein